MFLCPQLVMPSSTFPNWLQNYFQQPSATNSTYSPLNDNQGSSSLPGAFPNEEQTNLNQGQFIDSQAINSTLRSFNSWFNYLLIQPLILVMMLIFRVLSMLINIIYFRDHSASLTRLDVIDPVSKASRFIRDLEENLEPPQIYHDANNITVASASSTNTNTNVHDPFDRLPPFLLSSYTQALYLAKTRAKFLFIYISNAQRDEIFSNIITNQEFIKLFQNNNFIIWGGDVRNLEAFQVGNSLNVTKYPFLGLLCLTRTTKMTPQGPTKTSPKISLIAKLQGNIKYTPNLVEEKFLKKIRKYDRELDQMREELYFKSRLKNRNQ